MRNLLFVIFILSFININAQPEKGHYILIKKEPFYHFDEISSFITKEKICSSSPEFSKTYFCVFLEVFDGNRIYLHIKTSFNTGNTITRRSGDYFVDLTAVGGNSYSGENRSIKLTLEINKNNEIEILVHNRVEFLHSKGILNRKENSFIVDKTRYTFKKESDTQLISAHEAITKSDKLIGLFGVNYGAYKVFKEYIVWEDITKWDSKKEVNKLDNVDINSFEVYNHPYKPFYLILISSHLNFPDGYTDYAKDKKHVYYQGKIMPDVDPSDFQIIDPLHAKTNTEVYYKGTIIPNADADTFEGINGGYAIDKNQYYHQGKIVKKDKNIKKATATEMKKKYIDIFRIYPIMI